METDGQREAIVGRLIDAQRHRGPDHEALVSHHQMTAGYVRLAIQEPTPEGNQPVTSADDRFALVLNGEIYNYRELRAQHSLPDRGSDAHVVVALWGKLGPACLKLFRGMYSLAVIDKLNETLTIARDPFGIKPLYYTSDADSFTFSSELRPLLRLNSGHRLDRRTLAGYLEYGSYGPDETPIAGIHALPPGSILTVSLRDVREQRDKFSCSRSGSLTSQIPAGTPDEAATELMETVKAHLISDVPVALLLSAGVDSTMLALAAARLGTQLHCLTVDGPGMADESPVALATARRYGHSHEVVAASLTDEDLACFIDHMQRPTIDGLNTYLVSSAVKSAGFRVAISGLGGDEALAGYSHARIVPYLQALSASDRIPDPVKELGLDGVKTLARGRGPNAKARRLLLSGGPRTGVAVSALQREVFPPTTVANLMGLSTADEPYCREVELPAAATPLQAWSSAERTLYMGSMLLPDSDAFSMAHSVELRVPFVDLPFFRAAQAMPARVKRQRGKHRLVAALGDEHLNATARRTKTGFGLPMKNWLLTGPLRPSLLDARQADAPIWDHLDHSYSSAVLADEVVRTRWAEAWTLVALNLWLRSANVCR